MPDTEYEILLERGRCLLSYGDDEYKDKDKDKDAEKIIESLTVCHIFGILMTQAFQE